MGAGPFTLSVLATCFAAPALLAALPAGRMSDRAGGAVVAVLGAVVALGGTVGALLVSGPVPLCVAAGVVGLGFIVVMVGQQTFVAHASRGGDSDAAFGMLTTAASLGQLAGPPLVTAAASIALIGGDVPDTTTGLVLCTALMLLAIPVAIPLRRRQRGRGQDRAASADPERVWRLLRTPQMAPSLVVSGAVLVSVDLLYAFLPVWAIDRGVDVEVVGALLATRAAVTVVSRAGLSRLVRRFGRRALILAAISAAVAGLLALPFVGPWGAVAAMVALGVGLGIPQPLTMSWVTSLTRAESHGTALGMRLSSNRAAQIVVPLAVGAAAGPLGVVGIFWGNAVVLLGAMGVMVATRPARPDAA
jgi:MFS family permease